MSRGEIFDKFKMFRRKNTIKLFRRELWWDWISLLVRCVTPLPGLRAEELPMSRFLI